MDAIHDDVMRLRRGRVFHNWLAGHVRAADLDAMGQAGFLDATRRDVGVQLSSADYRRVQNALDPSIGTAGGFLTNDVVDQLLAIQIQTNPLVRYCDVATEDGETFVGTQFSSVATVDATANEGTILAAGQQDTDEDDPSFGQVRFPAHKFYSKKKKIPHELMRDMVAFQSALTEMLMQPVARHQSRKFVAGASPSGPIGLTVQATVGATTASPTATLDEVIDLLFSLDALYIDRAALLMSKTTKKTLLKLKDGSGNYAWPRSPLANTRIVTAPYMPEMGTSGNIPIVAADFSKVRIKLSSFRIHHSFEENREEDVEVYRGYQFGSIGILDDNAVRSLQIG